MHDRSSFSLKSIVVCFSVTGLPPKPNHVIPKFHNRSNLFPSTCTNKLYEEKHNQSNNRQVWSANPRLRQHTEKELVQNDNVNNITIETGKTALTQNKSTLRRRPCSAKARLESSSKPSKHHVSTPGRNDTNTTLDNTLSNTCMMLVPVNGKEVPVVDIGGDAPFPAYHYLFTSKEKYVSEEALPFLPGLAENRIPSLGLYHSPEVTTTDNTSIKPHVQGLNSFQVLYGTEHEGKPHDIKYDLTVPTVVKPQRYVC